MKLPRTFTVDERQIITRALALAAAESRTTRAQQRTNELLSRTTQATTRSDLDRLAHHQDRLAVVFADRELDIQLVEPQVSRPSRRG